MERSRLAVIDLDGTLLKGMTAERAFVLFLLRTGRLSAPRILSFMFSFYRDILTRGFRTAIGTNASYLRGRDYENVETWAREFGRDFLKGSIPESLRARIAGLKGSGCLIVLMSGSLQVLVDQLKDTIGADILIGGTLEIEDGRLTGRKTGVHPYGRDKVEALIKRIPASSIDWENSWALADTAHDEPLLELVGNPVAVNPDRRLRRRAAAEGWEVIG